MKIKGTVTDIKFTNVENGYTVLELRRYSDGERIICVGAMPSVYEGEEMELIGEMKRHSKFGDQFSVSEYKVSAPESAEGIVKFLSSGLIKGIGEVTAKAIVREFGTDALKVIEGSPEMLSKISGISMKKARKIGESFNDIRDMQEQVMFLQGYNITVNLAMRIYKTYEGETIGIVKNNPYKLIDDVDGVGFLTADKIAQSMGYGTDSDFRLRAGVIYALKESAERNGNTYLTVDELKESMYKILRIDGELIDNRFDGLIDGMEFDMSVRRLTVGESSCVALSALYNTERSIAGKLIKLLYSAAKPKVDESLITHFENVSNIKLHPAQRAAVVSAVENGVAVITGGPGTGKTTIIRCICFLLDSLRISVECASPTGRAAKRMEQATGREAKTIHRLLEPDFSRGMFFSRNENNPLDCEAVIVDETSMVDVYIFNSLLKAIRQGSRVILVGDKDQLPSVGAGNVLSDIIASGLVTVNNLTHIYRQDAESLIVSNAHLINKCEMPVINNKSRDFFFMAEETPEEVADVAVDVVTKRLPAFYGIAPIDIQVLAPMKAGASGVTRLNAMLQSVINPPARLKGEMRFGETVYRLGDKVMQTVNDYQMEWYKEQSYGKLEYGEGVFNGDLGIITELESGTMTITFDDGRTAQYTAGDLINLMPAYAVTVHKSQGSEFDVVVIPLCSGPPTILNKNLLYTAVTRAKKVVVLVGNRKHLYAMVKNNYIVTRNTLLKAFLSEENEKYRQYFT